MTRSFRFPAMDILPGKGYRLREDYYYFSPRYKKAVLVPEGYISDGASGPARDILTTAWLVHDQLCDDAAWEDKSPCSNWQASMVLKDILVAEGHPVIGPAWGGGTAVGRPIWNALEWLLPWKWKAKQKRRRYQARIRKEYLAVKAA